MNQLRNFASSSGDRPSIFFSSFSTSVIDSFRVLRRWYFTVQSTHERKNDGQSLLGCLLSLDQEPGRVSGLREARGAGDPGRGRQVSGARQSRKSIRVRDKSARGPDRVRQRAAGARRARRRRLPGGAQAPGRRRGQARHADRGRNELTTPAHRPARFAGTPPQERRGKMRGGTSREEGKMRGGTSRR